MMTNHLCRMQKSAVRRMNAFNMMISGSRAGIAVTLATSTSSYDQQKMRMRF
jgi:hypothetical protein